MAAVEGEPCGRRKTRNHGYDVIVGGGSIFTDYSITPRKHHAKPKTQINRRRTLYQLLSRWWDAYRKQLGLSFSPKKVRTLRSIATD